MCLQTRLFICTTRLPSVVSNYPGPQLAKGAHLGSRFSCAHLAEQWKQRARARANFGPGRRGPHAPLIAHARPRAGAFSQAQRGHAQAQNNASTGFVQAHEAHESWEQPKNLPPGPGSRPGSFRASSRAAGPSTLHGGIESNNRVEVHGGRAWRAAAAPGGAPSDPSASPTRSQSAAVTSTSGEAQRAAAVAAAAAAAAAAALSAPGFG